VQRAAGACARRCDAARIEAHAGRTRCAHPSRLIMSDDQIRARRATVRGMRTLAQLPQSLDAGITSVRFIASLVFGKGLPGNAAAYASGRSWKDRDVIVEALRALDDPLAPAREELRREMISKAGSDAVDLSSGIASPSQAISVDLVEMLRPSTLIGRIPGMRQTPVQEQIVMQRDGAYAGYVDEGAPAPVVELAFEAPVFLQNGKIVVIVPYTKTLAMLSKPGAEATVRADLKRAMSLGADRQFIDPNIAAAGDAPASITHGGHQVVAAGSTIADVDAALADALAWFSANNIGLDQAVWVMSSNVAARLALKRGSSGAPAYPLLTAKGGALLGLPVFTSNACELQGSPNESVAALIDADSIAIADEGASISVSTAGSLQMTTTPSGGAAQMYSLFQNNLIAVRASRFVNWALRRPGVAVIRGAQVF